MEGDMFGSGESPIEEVVAQEPVEAIAEQPIEQPVEETPQGNITIPEPKAEPGFVPLAAVLDERDRRKKLEAEVEQYRQKQQTPQPEPIDPWSDLDGALSQRDQQVQAMLYQQKTQMSRRFAEIQHGKEAVDAAYQWAVAKCDEDPAFNQQVFASDDPVGFAIQQYQRDQIASNMTMDDFKAFQAWKQAQSNPQETAPIPAQQVPTIAQTGRKLTVSVAGNWFGTGIGPRYLRASCRVVRLS